MHDLYLGLRWGGSYSLDSMQLDLLSSSDPYLSSFDILLFFFSLLSLLLSFSINSFVSHTYMITWYIVK